MKKLVLLLMTLAVLLALALPVGAEETVTSDAATTMAPITTAPVTMPAPTNESADEEKTLIAEISAVIDTYSSDILSAGALILSAILTYFFRKRLLPGVGNALNVINGTVTGYEKQIKEFLEEALSERKELKEFATSLLERFTLQEGEVKTALDVVSKILRAQSDSLFDLLEHTNLPADTKAEIKKTHKEQLAEIEAMMGGGANET
jgi:hypothetical protein